MLQRYCPAAGHTGLAAMALLGCSTLAQAGGFWLTLGNPAASSDEKAKGAAVIVRADGCHNPAKAKLTGTAEGLANGRRVSVPLKLTRLAAPGAYAVHRNWPAEGAWVVKLVGQHMNHTTSALVPILPDGFHRESASFFPREPRGEEIEAALRTAAGQSKALQARAK